MTRPIEPIRRKTVGVKYKPIYVHPDLHESVKRLAELERTSMNEVVRYLVELAVAGQVRFPKEP